MRDQRDETRAFPGIQETREREQIDVRIVESAQRWRRAADERQRLHGAIRERVAAGPHGLESRDDGVFGEPRLAKPGDDDRRIHAQLNPLAQPRERPRIEHPARRHSHSIVAGGFPEMSYTTREMPFTSFTMRREHRSRKSYGNRAQWAVMKSTVSTARSDTT